MSTRKNTIKMPRQSSFGTIDLIQYEKSKKVTMELGSAGATRGFLFIDADHHEVRAVLQSALDFIDSLPIHQTYQSKMESTHDYC